MSTLDGPIRILMVDDSEGDIQYAVEALRDAKIQNQMDAVRDGNEASDYLWRRGFFRNAPRPDLVLLDLNLPGKDGRQLLREMKADSSLRDIPVVILTVSTQQEDREMAGGLGAHGYITKPVDIWQFIAAVKAAGNLCFYVAKVS